MAVQTTTDTHAASTVHRHLCELHKCRMPNAHNHLSQECRKMPSERAFCHNLSAMNEPEASRAPRMHRSEAFPRPVPRTKRPWEATRAGCWASGWAPRPACPAHSLRGLYWTLLKMKKKNVCDLQKRKIKSNIFWRTPQQRGMIEFNAVVVIAAKHIFVCCM